MPKLGSGWALSPVPRAAFTAGGDGLTAPQPPPALLPKRALGMRTSRGAGKRCPASSELPSQAIRDQAEEGTTLSPAMLRIPLEAPFGAPPAPSYP